MPSGTAAPRYFTPLIDYRLKWRRGPQKRGSDVSQHLPKAEPAPAVYGKIRF